MHLPINILPQATANTSLSERARSLQLENKIEAEMTTGDRAVESHHAAVKPEAQRESNPSTQGQLDTFA